MEFEKVRRRMEKDIAAIQVHTAESWARILLTNAAKLKDEKEQAKFWEYLTNPEEEDLEPPTLVSCGAPELVPHRVTVTVSRGPTLRAGEVQDECDEKSCEIELEYKFERNGMTLICRTKPV